MKYFNDARDWMFQRRLGLFVHWGIYALGEWHEQHIFRKHMTRAGTDTLNSSKPRPGNSVPGTARFTASGGTRISWRNPTLPLMR